MLTEDERIKYTALLADAEKVYHSAMLGGVAVSFRDQNGEEIRYSQANAGRLLGYINWLRQLLGLCPFAIMPTSRPAGALF